jgi:ABC transport system ATP-binding/permease protein
MTMLRDAIAAAERRLADPGLFARDPQDFNGTSRDLERLRVDLLAAEDRWLELEMLREELQG